MMGGKVSRRPKVAVVYKSLPQYRKRFFELLRNSLDDQGVDFVLIYGQPSYGDSLKRDVVDIPWAVKVHNRIWNFGGRDVYWQPVLKHLEGVDLVIVEQASKLLVNYVLLFRQITRQQRLAFWGHGINFRKHNASRLGEWLKRQISTRVHWWFAYTQRTAQIVERMGFPRSRITVVQNAIDTKRLAHVYRKLSPDVIESLRRSLGIRSRNVGLYIGGMYPEKRISFLLEASRHIRRLVPDFELLFLGSGVDAPLVEKASRHYHWIHYVGPKFEDEKIPYFALAKLLLLPGLVGLAILDSFALETPLVTTSVPFHSPEIDYLEPGKNGVIVTPHDDPRIYAKAVVELLSDETKRTRLVAGCRSSAQYYTVEEMVMRFANGVKMALER